MFIPSTTQHTMIKHQKTNRSLRLLAASAFLAAGLTAQAAVVTNWIAFDDHNPTAITHTNANTYNLRGIAGSPAQPTSGVLKDFVSGAPTPAYIISTATGTPDFFGSISYPNAGTPAYNLFNGIVDLGNTDSAIGVRSSANSTVTLIFSNLNPTARYIFRGTVVRGNNYVRRWTLSSLLSVDSFLNAHTAGVYTNGTGTIQANQAAFNSGENRSDGAVVGWDEIAPGADGVIQVKCEQYVDNPLPNGQTPDLAAYGYSFAGIMIAEVGEPVPASITAQPVATVNLEQNRPFSLSVSAIGAPAPTYQWYHGVDLIPGATTRTYSVNRAQVSDSGTYHVVVSNSGATVSSITSTVTVTPDTTKPTVLAAASPNGLNVSIKFSEELDPTSVTESLNYIINDGAISAQNPVSLRPDGRSIQLTLDTPITGPLKLSVESVRDLAGNTIAFNEQFGSVTNFNTGDVGTPGVDPIAAGSTFSADNAEYEIIAGGTDIWGNGDQGHLALQSRTGNFDVRIHLKGLTQADTVTKAGLMVRESTASGSRNLFINANPATGRNQIELGTRRATDGVTDGWGSTFVPAGIPSLWMRLERFGDTFYGYRSTNGQNWILMGTSTQDYPDTALVGMAVTAHNNAAAPTLATFDNLSNVSYPGSSITITQQPQSVSVQQNSTITLSVGASSVNIPSSEVRYQWISNGIPIDGANSPTLLRRFVTQADDSGDVYSVVVSGPGISVTSANATLTVTPDLTAPRPRFAIGPSESSILVYFNEPMSLQDAFGYSIENSPVGVSSAVLDTADPTLVRITTDAPLTPGTTYTLIIDESVLDNSLNPVDPAFRRVSFLSQVYTGDPSTLRQLPTDNARPLGSLTDRGFNSHFVQVAAVIANDNAVAEQMLAGTYLNPGNGLPWPNIATITNYVETNIINYKGVSTDVEGRLTNDLIIPGIPGTTGSRENYALEVLTYLELQTGIYRFGVNSDDGFRVTPATRVNDPNNSIVLGEFNGGRGATDSTYDVVVTQPGLYPMRLIYEQGQGGANVEWWSAPTLDSAANVVGVNGAGGIPAYRVAAAVSPRLAISHVGGNIVLSWPGSDTGYHVETKANINDPTWTTTGTIVVVNGQNTVTLPITGNGGYFRLAK